MDDGVEKLIIIGSGPAGLTAAIYAARGNLSPLVVSGKTPGGQLMLTTDVDDYPGFPHGVQGPQLMNLFRTQAEKFQARFLSEEVISVDFLKKPLIIETESKTLKAWSIIIASGASPKWLGLPSEQKLIGRGVSVCAVCDGPFFKDKIVAVVGGGDTAMRETQHLSKFAKEVILIHRREEFKAWAALQQMVKNLPNVRIILNSTVEEILGEDKVRAIKVKNHQTNEWSQLAVEGVFVAIGHLPNTSFLKRQVKLDTHGYIVVKKETQTSVPGVFVAGDVADYRYRQAVTAAGAGAKAVLDVEAYLARTKEV